MSSHKTRVVSNVIDGLAHCGGNGFPVKVQAHFVLGGWERTAATEDEAREKIREGLSLSPVEKVSLVWD